MYAVLISWMDSPGLKKKLDGPLRKT